MNSTSKEKKIRTPLDVLKRYLLYDWIYFFTPAALCLVYAAIAYTYTSLQYLINSIFQTIPNLAVFAGVLVSVPNVFKLISCQRKTLIDMPENIVLRAASSERYGGAGCGKTSSGVLQALFEAHEMEVKLTSLYYFIKSNYVRWLNDNPEKVKDFAELERSVLFWRSHPEYIPFLGSNITIHDTNGRRSYQVGAKELSQEEWMPALFALIDESGNLFPQEMWKERPAGITLMARYIRHFGFRISFLEQKFDGLYINVRAVMGCYAQAISQRNELLPHTLIDFIKILKGWLPRYDKDDHPEWEPKKVEKMTKHFRKLGHFIDVIQQFCGKLGFRIWDEKFSTGTVDANNSEGEIVSIYCTNELPGIYDEREFSQLYLPSEENPVKGDWPMKDNARGEEVLRVFREQEKILADAKKDGEIAAIKRENDMEKEKQRKAKLALSGAALAAKTGKASTAITSDKTDSDDTE